MSTEAIHDLNQYLSAINKLNNIDLHWTWAGTDTDPYIEVYEQAGGVVLTTAPISYAVADLRDALHLWDLDDPYEWG